MGRTYSKLSMWLIRFKKELLCLGIKVGGCEYLLVELNLEVNVNDESSY